MRGAIGPQVPAWASRLGARAGTTRHVPDTLADLCAALRSADGDLILTTGSIAAGARDHLNTAISNLGGSFLVREVAVRPGHPMVLATIGATVLVALPGNPQTAVAALLTLALPLIDRQLGRGHGQLPRVVTGEDLESSFDRERLVAGVISSGALAVRAGELAERGVSVIVTNADHPDIARLYAGFRKRRISRYSTLANDVSKRRTVTEALYFRTAGARRKGS